MKLSAAFLLGVATLVNCAPQEFTPEAEFVNPVSTGGGDEEGDGDYDRDYSTDYDPDYSTGFGFPRRRFFIVNVSPDTDSSSGSFHNIFRNLFTSLFSGRGNEDDQAASDDGTLFPLLPFIPPFANPRPDDFPDNYANETHHVHDVNGTRVEVNQTITKNTDDSGVFFHNVHVIRVVPEEDADAGTGSQDGTVFQEVPQEEPAKNQVKDEPYEEFA